ncbi:MAG: hypothetical protein IMW96_09990 [Thermoanaerobacteraceae bacterium]|nr:hypothetical protein [Thermoanaerobacteraceae bacterium]
MANHLDTHRAARIGALLYTGISLVAALLFLLLTYAAGKAYTPVARYGGAAWVFILTMIITMPLVIPWVQKRYRK